MVSRIVLLCRIRAAMDTALVVNTGMSIVSRPLLRQSPTFARGSVLVDGFLFFESVRGVDATLLY